MKKLISTVYGLILLGLAGQAQAIMLEFVPPSQGVNLGDPASVDLVISDLGNLSPPSLGAFDLDILFNDSILDNPAVTFGSELDQGIFGSFAASADFGNSVNLFEISFEDPGVLDALQPDSFVLATIGFDTIGIGTSALTINLIDLGDSLGNTLSATVGTGSITVRDPNAVPEPATLALMVLGLAGFGVSTRRKRAA